MKNVLVLLDHFREDDYKVDRYGQVHNNFNHSYAGKLLKNLLERPRHGFNLKPSEYHIELVYPFTPPKIGDAYRTPSKTKLAPYVDKIKQLIIKENYDLVIMFGSLAINNLLELDRGTPKFSLQERTYTYNGQSKTVMTATLPHLIKLSQMTRINHDNFVIISRLIKRYLKGGKENLKPQMGKYEYVTDFDRVKQIFEEVIPSYKLVATDFETNTLKTWLDGAKVIMFSCSWLEHQGVAIPIDHRNEPNLWTKEQRQAIIDYILKLYDNPNITKVMHNANYDLSMLMNVWGMEHATNVVDTMMCYYLVGAEENGTQRGLKHLASMYTDMHDYEAERDKAFDDYLANDYARWEQEQKDKGIPIKKSNYTPPTNSVDGGKIDFEWLPLDVIYPYAAADTDVTLQLYHLFDKTISKPEHKAWRYLAYDFYPKLIETLAYIEHTGFHLNLEKAKRYQQYYDKQIKQVAEKMYQDAPEIAEIEQQNLEKLAQRTQLMKQVKPANRTEEQKAFIKEVGKLIGTDSQGVPKYKFNPASRSQLKYIIFEVLGYQVPLENAYLSDTAVKQHKLSHPEKLTYNDFKIDSKVVLPYLKKTYHDPFIDDIIVYTRLCKIQSSFIEPLISMADKHGNVHPTFSTVGTATSRLACKNPKNKLGL